MVRTSTVGWERLNSCSDSSFSKACFLSAAFRFVTAFLSSLSNLRDSVRTFSRTTFSLSGPAWKISSIDAKECTAMPDPIMRYPSDLRDLRSAFPYSANTSTVPTAGILSPHPGESGFPSHSHGMWIPGQQAPRAVSQVGTSP